MLYTPAGMAQPDATTSPGVIDMAYLESCSFGQDDLVLRAIDVLLDQLPEQVSELSRALVEADWNGLRLAAHSLKSAAGILGMESIRLSLCEIEARTQSSAAGSEGMAGLVAEVTRACRIAKEELVELRSRYAGTS